MKLKETEVLVLRKTNEDMTSNGVKFPRRGWVESHWNAMRGFGIHGLEWGAGEFHLEHYGRQDKSGVDRYSTEIIADVVRFLDTLNIATKPPLPTPTEELAVAENRIHCAI